MDVSLDVVISIPAPGPEEVEGISAGGERKRMAVI
jgi:hypothetical protein